MAATMNLIKKLNQAFVIERLENTDWTSGNSAPLVVELDPTAVCDLACPGCISADIVAVGNSFSKDRLIEIGQEFVDAGVKAVILIGGGEPLAHPKTGELISLLGKNDVHIGITTNGTFINRFLEPISEYAQWTRVSVDAGSNEMFTILRPTKGGRSKFERIIENMRMLAKTKKGVLGFSYLIQTEADGPGIKKNTHEIFKAAQLSKDIGCDYFEVKPTYQFRNDAVHKLMIHKEEYMNEAREQINLLDSLEDENFKILKAINLEYSINGVNVKQPKSYKKCPSTHLRTTVTPSGVYICPYWRGKKEFKIGDLNKTKFSELWNGSERKNIMDRTDISVACKDIHCLRHETNNKCIEIKNKIEQKSEISIVDEFDRFI